MARIELPYNDDRQFVMDLLEEQRHAEISIAWTERLHVLTTAACCFLALWVALAHLGIVGLAMASGLGVLCLIALVLSSSIRLVLMDLYRQFHYREKFVLFLLHVAVIIVPRFMFGIDEWGVLFGILLLFLCVQAFDFVYYSRIYAFAGVAVLQAIIFGETAPSVLLVALWYVSLMLAIRFGHIRFRIDAFGEGRGVYIGEMLRRTVVPVVLPVVVGLGAWYLAPYVVSPRRIEFDPGMIARDGTDVNISYSQLIWESFLIMFIVIALLLVLHYLDKKLKLRRKGKQIEINTAASSIRAYRRVMIPGNELIVSHEAGPRERIISAFRQFNETLGKINLGRAEQESIEDYMARLAGHYSAFRVLATSALKPFNKACYGEDSPTISEAESFENTMRQGLACLRRELASAHQEVQEEPGPGNGR